MTDTIDLNVNNIDDDDLELLETQTVAEFFGGMRRFTYVTFSRQGRVGYYYVFLGHYYDEEDNYVPRVADAQNGAMMRFTEEQLNAPNDGSFNRSGYVWAVATENDAVKSVPREHQTAIANLADYREAYDRMIQKRNEGEQAKADFRTLNAKINEYATEQGMCPDYERRLDRWNVDLVHMKLVGRPRDWEVQVRIPSMDMQGYIRVNATSPTAANETVEKMSGAQVLAKMLEAGIQLPETTELIAEITRRAE